jgi:hypothetical protein
VFPSDLIVGEDGPVVIVSARVARVLDRYLARERINLRGMDPELDATLAALHSVGEVYAAQRSTRIEVASEVGSAEVDSVEPLPSSTSMVTVREAAHLLGRSTRRVRQLVAEGQLTPAGGPPYVFDREDIEALADNKDPAA